MEPGSSKSIPPGICVQKDLESFIKKCSNCSKSPCAMLFPPFLGDILLQNIRYQAFMHNLQAVYIGDDQFKSVAVFASRNIRYETVASQCLNQANKDIGLTNPTEVCKLVYDREFKANTSSPNVSTETPPSLCEPGPSTSKSESSLSDIKLRTLLEAGLKKINYHNQPTRRASEFSAQEIENILIYVSSILTKKSIQYLSEKIPKFIPYDNTSPSTSCSQNSHLCEVERLIEKRLVQVLQSSVIRLRKHKYEIYQYLGDTATILLVSEDYRVYQHNIDKMLGHIIELYEFPPEVNTEFFLNIYTENPKYIKWCDDKHVLLVTSSEEHARRVLQVEHDLVKSRTLQTASPVAIVLACHSDLPVACCGDSTAENEN